ncbi:serine carboxypeptidase-like 47 [Phtheirospermum japonicum]|uniref:Carboxypeptidase n=1 Tax=Phtheirospermum japonicum TaxID=374723 RepID=A0A830DCU1_9LAMI|nr:serine carboxypeptidase-like 47 [Phtheirospermum japonicum]
MFYYLFESRTKRANAPFIVHLTGGPGFSSSLALFFDDVQVASILFVDQPIGTGFSYSTSETDIPTTSEKVAVDFYNFLQEFLKKRPEYAKKDLYISGESYAGHYIPAVAARINHGNNNNQGPPIKLKVHILYVYY